MKITASQLKTIIKEELANMAGTGESSPHGSGYEMMEEKEEPSLSDQINDVIIDVLRQEGGAAGYDPIKDAVVKAVGMEKAFDEMLKMAIVAHADVTQHEDGDYIETSGLR
tara:strand:- start:116 stop:448 length:333 start_codon:yes stop_codon:yes gene_type:complete